MTADDITTLRDEALRKIGRNVVLYQKLEAMMKFVAAHAEVNANAAELESVINEQRMSVDRKTLGQLTRPWIERLFSKSVDLDGQSSSGASGSESESTGVKVGFEFFVETTESQRMERQTAINKLLEDRNALVHQRLAAFNPDSVESCQRLIVELDEAYAVLRPEVTSAAAIIKTFRDITAEMKRWVDSEEGIKAFREAALPLDAKH